MITFHPGILSATSGFITANLPGITISLQSVYCSILHSLANAPITDPPNLPADQAVRTEYPARYFRCFYITSNCEVC